MIWDQIEAVAADPVWLPRRGFHGDPLPAVHQVRRELQLLLDELEIRTHNSCLQLGMGLCDASHEVWRRLFPEVVTLDLRICKYNDHTHEGLDTHSAEAIVYASSFGMFDFLFIDAGHTYNDVYQDFRSFSPLVRSGGIIAFHDALRLPSYPHHEVWRFVGELHDINMIGSEVGVAWLIKT